MAQGVTCSLAAVFRQHPFPVIMPTVVRKTALKVKRATRDPYRKLSEEEIRLARMWYSEGDMEPSEIASLL